MTDETTDQAPEQSVEDRIAEQFGVQETPEQPAEVEVAPESDFAEVEYEGSRYQVPKQLEKAILQEADYTRKTQEVAQQRKLMEQSQSALKLAGMERDFETSVAEDVQQVRAIDNYLKTLKSQNFNEMTAEDGFRQWMLIQQANDHREALNKTIDGKRTEFQTKLNSAIDDAKEQARDLLAKQLPGFTPDSVKAARNYAKSQGFTDLVIDSIETDGKSALVLHKAMLFDKLQSEKTTAAKKLDAPVIKPGSSNPMPQAVKDKFAFNKAMKAAPNSQAKARLIEERLAKQF